MKHLQTNHQSNQSLPDEPENRGKRLEPIQSDRNEPKSGSKKKRKEKKRKEKSILYSIDSNFWKEN